MYITLDKLPQDWHFLSQVDRTLDHAFKEGGKVLHVFGFVDDFFSFAKGTGGGLYGHQS